MKRRNMLKTMATMPVLASPGLFRSSFASGISNDSNPPFGYKIKLSLNAVSFNRLLRDGTMDLFDMIDFCAEYGFDAVDPTAYFFPGYPDVPPDEYLYDIKRKAFLNGLAISGTGIRNDFTEPDEMKRRDDIHLIKKWIQAASKMGAPVIRIFAGHLVPEEYSREQILQWMVKDIQECVEFGRNHGVMVAVQNHHNAFLKTAAQTRELMERVGSEWFGLILDTGSYRQGDAYKEIADIIPYAVSWQLKELIYVDGVAEDIDLVKFFGIIKSAGYRGYVPVETLGPGDQYVKVTEFVKRIRQALQE